MSEPRSRNTLRDTGLYCGFNSFTCRFCETNGLAPSTPQEASPRRKVNCTGAVASSLVYYAERVAGGGQEENVLVLHTQSALAPASAARPGI